MRISVEEKYKIFKENKKNILENASLENNKKYITDNSKLFNKLNVGKSGKGRKYKFRS